MYSACFAEILYLACEPVDIRVAGYLGYLLVHADIQVNQARITERGNGLLMPRTVGSGKDIHLVAPLAQLCRQLTDIDIHPSRILSSQFAHGATVEADHRYFQFPVHMVVRQNLHSSKYITQTVFCSGREVYSCPRADIYSAHHP